MMGVRWWVGVMVVMEQEMAVGSRSGERMGKDKLVVMHWCQPVSEGKGVHIAVKLTS